MDKIDILSREKFVKQLITITENIANSKKSTSFAINGIWGSGKSFVLDMFEEELTQIQSEETKSDKYFIIRYNCWEYDYYITHTEIKNCAYGTLPSFSASRMHNHTEQKAQ